MKRVSSDSLASLVRSRLQHFVGESNTLETHCKMKEEIRNLLNELEDKEEEHE